MPVEPAKIGIIGCGDICGQYLRNARRFPTLEVAACADRIGERADTMAREHGVPRACSLDELLADPAVEIAVNLTNPAAHFEVSLKAIEAGKHVYSEKPLALTRDDAARLLAAAKERGVRVGCAPDTFLGAGIQTARKLLDDGAIGEPVGATAFWMDSGPESWHPAPDFLFKPGAGPMLDIGPYFITVLVVLVGPVRRVAAMARTTYPTRTVGSGPLQGTPIHVEVPTLVAGTVEFAAGQIASVIQTWDVQASTLPLMEIYGTEGSLHLPDAVGFGGPVRLRKRGERDWHDVPLTHAHDEIGRGLGIADMAAAIRSGRPHRANGELAAHVLDVMLAFHEAADTSRTVELATACERPAAIPPGLPHGVLDE